MRNILSDLGVLVDLLCVMHKGAAETEKNADIRTVSVPEYLNSGAKTEEKGEKDLNGINFNPVPVSEWLGEGAGTGLERREG